MIAFGLLLSLVQDPPKLDRAKADATAAAVLAAYQANFEAGSLEAPKR